MSAVSGYLNSCSGLVGLHRSKTPSGIYRCNEIRFCNHTAIQLVSRRLHAKNCRNKPVLSASRDNHQFSYEDDLIQEPFWLTLLKEAIWGLRSLFEFLIEQPSQLKYIEWPAFQSTVKTATLTLVLVAMFIVALSSVDSVLCFLLALLLRRTA